MYSFGEIPVLWNDSYKKLNFIKKSVPKKEIDMWESLGYYHKNFSGTMYDSQNPMPEWTKEVTELFPNLKNKTCTLYRMDTLEIMPTHVDHFSKYCEIFKVKKHDVRRIIVFLEDWKPGHYFEVAGKGVVNWKAGDYCIWDPDVEHAASNIGIESRYTLQITGHV